MRMVTGCQITVSIHMIMYLVAQELNSMRTSHLLLFVTLSIATLGCAQRSPSERVLIADLEQREDVNYLRDQPFTGSAYYLDKDGAPLVMRSYVEGKREGEWMSWYADGVLHKSGNTLNGEEHGQYREYYPDGTLHYEYHYDRGAKTGKWLSWYEDGKPYTERNFKNNQLDGELVYWLEDGTLKKKERYSKGRMISTTKPQ